MYIEYTVRVFILFQFYDVQPFCYYVPTEMFLLHCIFFRHMAQAKYSKILYMNQLTQQSFVGVLYCGTAKLQLRGLNGST